MGVFSFASLRRASAPSRRGCSAHLLLLLSALAVLAISPAFPCDAPSPGAKVSVASVVSGTYRFAGGCFNSAGGRYVTQMKLWIGDTQVNSYTYGVDDNEKKSTRSLGRVWASTHFPHGTYVPVRLWGKDSAGNERQNTKNTYIYNKAYVLGNQALDWARESVARVRVRSTELNHSASPATVDEAMDDDKPTILQNIPAFTVFYMDTHSNVGIFVDCLNVGVIAWNEVLTGDHDKSGEPEYNLVFIDGCLTAADNSLARGFRVVNPDNGQLLPDKCLLGWDGLTSDSERNCDWVNCVWQGLVGELTLTDAVNEAKRQFPPDGVPRGRGQGGMKLAGAYQGAPGQWYR